jgi:hypothetical protein
MVESTANSVLGSPAHSPNGRGEKPSSPSGALGPAGSMTPMAPSSSSAAAGGGAGAEADAHHSRGFALRRKGDFAGAIAEYTKAIEMDPNHFKAYFNRCVPPSFLGT